MAGTSTRPATLLIDTNLLLVLLVGSQDRQQVPRFKRTSAYTAEDYDFLATYVGGFTEMVVTPNVLTEASNLLGQLREPFRSRALSGLAQFALRNEERYVPSRRIVEEVDFRRLGLTDLSILMAAGDDVAILTDDLELYLKLAGLNLHVVNFHHLRRSLAT